MIQLVASASCEIETLYSQAPNSYVTESEFSEI